MTRVSEIARNKRGGRIYMGGHEAELDLPSTPIHLHIETALETKALRTHTKTRRVRVPLDDAPWNWRQKPDEVRGVLGLARQAAQTFRRGGVVLVTCHQGRNRSGLIVGFALRMLGKTPKEAVALIRAKRGPLALSNRSFVEAITHAGRQNGAERRIHQETLEEDGLHRGGTTRSDRRDPEYPSRGASRDWEGKHARRRALETGEPQGEGGVRSDDGGEADVSGDGLDLGVGGIADADLLEGLDLGEE
jgi:protein-tyrosine phosphatase